VASNEARIANDRRQEVLRQMLSGAGLGLSDVAQQRATQSESLRSLQGQLGGTQASLFNAFTGANTDRNRQIREAEAAAGFDLQGGNAAIQALLAQDQAGLNAFNAQQAQAQFGAQFSNQQNQQAFGNQQSNIALEDALASAAQDRNLTGAETAQKLGSLPRNSLGRVRGLPNAGQNSGGLQLGGRRRRF